MNQSTETSRKPARMLVERPDIQELSIDAIVVDEAFQSRIATDPEHVLVFDEMIRNGMEIHPVVVFWTGERYILADGFHRYHAHKKRPGVRSIRAEIKQGSERDAMVYSAGANRLSIKSPSATDRRKAAFMLFADSEWWEKSNGKIGSHIGASERSVGTYRKEYRIANNLPKTKGDGVYKTKGGYHGRIDGKLTWLGPSEPDARKRMASEKQKHETGAKRVSVHSMRVLTGRLLTSGIPCEPLRLDSNAKITAKRGQTFCIDTGDTKNVDSIRNATLNVILARESCGIAYRAVVACYPADATSSVQTLIDLARKLDVEFLTPDEFIASVKAD